MLSIKSRHAHADARPGLVTGLGIRELFVMRIIHPDRDECGLMAMTTAIDEDLNYISSIQYEPSKRIRLLTVTLMDPCIVFVERQNFARPHRHHAQTRLKKMGIDEARHFIHGGIEHFLPKGFAS
jgi:hypothetical protein